MTTLPRLLSDEIDPVELTALGNVSLVWSHAELARSLYVLDAVQRQRRWGRLGLWTWRIARYLNLRCAADAPKTTWLAGVCRNRRPPGCRCWGVGSRAGLPTPAAAIAISRVGRLHRLLPQSTDAGRHATDPGGGGT